MVINTQKFLPSSKGGALAKVAKISKGSVAVISEKSQQNIGIIKVKVIEIDKLLKGTVASQKKALDIKRKEGEKKRFSELETKLETKPKAEKGKIEMPKLPRMGFLDWIKNFIGNIILGYFAVRLVDQLPKLKGVISFIGKASDFVLNIGGKLLDGLVTFIDWGYKAYDATRGFMKNLFGEGGVKQFDQLSGLLNKFLNLAIIAGLAVAGSGGFGGGGRGGSAAAARSRPGQGGRPKVTKSGGGGQGRPDIRNPLRQRSAVTTGGSKQFRLPGSGARVTGGGGSNRLLLSQVRPFLKRIPLPVVGALVDFGLSVALGESPGRAAFRAIGAGLLGAVGAAAGTVVPVAGNFIGGLLGGVAGDAIGGILYDMFFGGKTPIQKGKTTKSAGGGTAKGQKRRTLNTKKRKYKRKLAPRKPGQIQMQPGADVGGEDKLFGLFPNPLKAAQNAIDMMNPFKVIENTGKELGKSDYFGPILAITSKILLGQKPNQKDYENVGLGINLLVSGGLNEGQLKGGLAAAFAEGGLVDPKTLDAISQGSDITNWVAKAFKDSTESNTQETLRYIQDNLRLKKEQPPAPAPGSDGPGGIGGEYSPEGLQGDIYKYLLSKGMDDTHALGLMANISRESGFRPGVLEEGGGGGVGLWQYTSEPRRSNFLKAVPDYKTNWKAQIDYALKEPGEPGQQYLSTKFSSPQEAADWFMRKWERPAEYIQNDKGPKIHAQYLSGLQKYRTQKGYNIPGSMNIAGMDKGGVGGSVAEYITGDPNTPFGRFDRAGHGTPGNYHDHIAFKDRNTAVRAYNFFKSKGIQVTEFKGFDSVGGHANGSLHYSGLAFDVPGAQWGGSGAIGSRDYAGSGKVRKTLKEFLGGSSSPIIAKAYAKGGETLGGPHLAMLGEKGREIVVDADSSGPARDMLLAINQEKDHKGVMKAIQQYAPYDAMSPQTIVMPSSGGESDYDSEMVGGGVMMMDGGGEDSYDPFDALEMGG
jgi:hypothetical protein